MRVFRTFLLLQIAVTGSVQADNWPQWRGPSGTGIVEETGLPVRWGSDENVAWRAPLSGLGVSSPIVWGDRIFLTYQTGPGVLRGGTHPTLARGPGIDPALERPLGEARGAGARDEAPDEKDAGSDRVTFVVVLNIALTTTVNDRLIRHPTAKDCPSGAYG